MGRKPVPQPLSLGHSSVSSAHRPGQRPPANISDILTSPHPTVLGAPSIPSPSDRHSPRDSSKSTSTLHVTSTSASSKSPKSPRSPHSPFSKFNPNRNPPIATDGNYIDTQKAPGDVDAVQPTLVQNPALPSPTIPRSATSSVVPDGPVRRHGQRRNPDEEKHTRNGSRFFNFGKPSKSSHHLQQSQTEGNLEAMSRGPEHSTMPDGVSSKDSKHSDQPSIDHSNQRNAPPLPSRSDLSLPSTTENDSASFRRNKSKQPFALLGRTRSIKEKDGHSPKESLTIRMAEPERAHLAAQQQPLKTAPINSEANDMSFRHMMNSAPRNHSADRALPRDMPTNKENRNDKDSRSHPSSYRENGGSFFNGLKSSGSRAADMISKGLFGKSGRSTSTSEREHVVDDEHYVLKVINLPLVEQTRLTRISKRLEESRDKTEFWMPAFPWRAIDYLNFNGTEVEGLYRVPGSGPQIKKWQRRFDEEYDVDLFAQDDLYDINIIGSMLKAWLRELPDELFPKEAQERISRECAGAEEVPQMLIDELSNLSPFNYYLLFAITCHLSLLLAHSDKNKMDFRNLCICFQPCMKIDAFCFKFLVCDWRLCWQGCKKEARFIEEEYMLFDQPMPRGLGADTQSIKGSESYDERAPSSSDSGKHSATAESQNSKIRKKPVPPIQSNANANGTPKYSNNLTVQNQEVPRRSGDLRPLSPIKPLSPLGF